MIILLTGLPGVGKGTQAELIVKKYKIEHLSTGNIFRTLMNQTNELSLELKSYINQGNLVPDELTIKILQNEIKKPQYQNGFLLDGFPRTVEQAKFLDELLTTENITLDHIINLYLDNEIIKDRLVNRLFCPKCQATFHTTQIPPKKVGICDNCQSELIQRDDDKPEKIVQRIAVAKEQTVPVLDHYGDKVKTVDTNGKSKGEIFAEIENILSHD